MPAHNRYSLFRIALGILAALTLCVGLVACSKTELPEEPEGKPSEMLVDKTEQYKAINPSLIHYKRTIGVAVEMQKPRAVAVSPEDRVFVAGDKAVAVFSPELKLIKTIALDGEPFCLAVAGKKHVAPGRLYIGMKDHVETFDADGKRQAVWPQLGKSSVLTSIAVGEEDIFVADAGSKVVWHLDRNGKVIGQIGRRDPSRNIEGFIVPSPYFDVAIAPDGLLRVTNPGRQRVEAYTIDGHFELSWGKSGTGVEAFCGCCSPSNIAIMPDGRVVTAEKGIPRVKLYSAEGKFECVVAGPQSLASSGSREAETSATSNLPAVDVAVNSQGRVVVLDPAAGCVRIFVKKPEAKEDSHRSPSSHDHAQTPGM
jgi:hypothetical protein